MLVLGIITVILTAFVLIFYGYLARRTDHDVSFFISIELIFLVMNLCTNASEGARVLAWLYLVAGVACLAIGFAISVQDTLGFYRSIGPWMKSTFTSRNIGFELLSFILPPVGIVFYFVFDKSDSERAAACGKLAMWGILVWLLAWWLISGII